MFRSLGFIILLTSAQAADIRVLVDGAGCRTRQLAIQRIWERLPKVDEVVILPREERPAPNQRYFVIRCHGDAPALEKLNDALGNRVRHYKAIEVEPMPEQGPEE